MTGGNTGQPTNSGGTQQLQGTLPKQVVPSVSTAYDLCTQLENSVPSGPTLVARQTAGNDTPWRVVIDNNKAVETIYLPKNLAADWLTDYQAMAGGLAAKLLAGNTKSKIQFSSKDWDTKFKLDPKVNKSVAQYFAGVCYAFKNLPNEAHHDWSGDFGQGYRWVAFVALTAETKKLPALFIKGSRKSPSEILSKSVWGTTLTDEQKALEALLRRAAGGLGIKDFKSHCKSIHALKGHGIRKSLPWQGQSILTQDEVTWFDTEYKSAVDASNLIEATLKNESATLVDYVALPARITALAQLLVKPEQEAQTAIGARFKALAEGLPRKVLAIERKRPIRDRVAGLPMERYLRVFHPLMIHGRYFNLPEGLLEAFQNGANSAQKEVTELIDTFIKGEQNAELRILAYSWFASEVNSGRQ
jgi:hypothetical protein